MSGQQEQLSRLQAALTQLSAPPATAAVFYPGAERYSMITFLLQKLLTPDLVNALQQRVLDMELPAGLSAEEAQAHRLARMLHAVNFQATADQVRGSTSEDDSLRLLTSLAGLAAAHQQHSREATAAAAVASSAANGRAPSPGTAPSPMASQGPNPLQRQRTPSRGGSAGGQLDGGVGGARPLLSLQSLDGEMRLLDSLAERLPQILEPGGGGNWFPADIMAAVQPFLQSHSAPELAAIVEQRSQRLKAELPALRAEESRLAAEVTVVGETEWQQHAEATRVELGNLLETSASFYHTFQTGLGVWCAASRAADTCGLGPMAAELLQRYDTLRRLGGDLARIRQAHSSIVSCAPPLTLLEQHNLSQLVHAGQEAVEQVQGRIAVEQRVLAEPDTARAMEVIKAVGLALPVMASM